MSKRHKMLNKSQEDLFNLTILKSLFCMYQSQNSASLSLYQVDLFHSILGTLIWGKQAHIFKHSLKLKGLYKTSKVYKFSL